MRLVVVLLALDGMLIIANAVRLAKAEQGRRQRPLVLPVAPWLRPMPPPARVWWTPRKRLPPTPAQTSAPTPPAQVALREVVIPREDGLGHRVVHYPVSAVQLEREKLLFLLFGANGVFAAIEQRIGMNQEAQLFKN